MILVFLAPTTFGAEYCLPHIFWLKLARRAAQFLCDSWATCYLCLSGNEFANVQSKIVRSVSVTNLIPCFRNVNIISFYCFVITDPHKCVISTIFACAWHVFAMYNVAAACEDTVPAWTCAHYKAKDYCAASYQSASYVTGVCPVTCG